MNTLFLFTKKFPYGMKEAYLFDELPFLREKFDNVIIVPYDEFEYNENENRIKNIDSIEIFCINKHLPKISLFNRMQCLFIFIRIWLFEIFNGRDAKMHISNFKRVNIQIKQAYAQALTLIAFQRKYLSTNYLYYNYWLHRGVVIGSIVNILQDIKVSIISRAHAYDLYHKNWHDFVPKKSKNSILPFETWKINQCKQIFSISQSWNESLS
jgi:hypothetical protein